MSAVPLPLPTTLARPGGVDATYAERAAPGSRGQLVDRFGRVHRDLRISLTDRCSLRCTYCMPEQGVEWLAKSSILTTDEIVRVAGVLASLGIVEVREGEASCERGRGLCVRRDGGLGLLGPPGHLHSDLLRR